MQVTHFNKFTISRELRPRLAAALSIVEEDLGIKIDLGTSRFSPEKVTMKLTAIVKTDSGEVFDEDRANFDVFCRDYGLEPEHLDREFTHEGKRFAITGLRTRAKKYKIRATDQSGNNWRFPIAYVLKNLVEE